MTHKGENYSVKMQKYYFCSGTLLSVRRWTGRMLLYTNAHFKHAEKRQNVHNFYII